MRHTAVLVVALALAVAACGSDSSADTSSGSSTEVTATDSTTAGPASSTTVPSTTAPSTTGPSTTGPSTTVPPTTGPPVTDPPVTEAPTTTLPPFPPSLTDLPDPPDVWSVVLAGSADVDDPVLAQAVADADAAGYFVGPTDCDEGAAEAIGMAGNGVYTITVYLNSEADARAAAEAFAARGVEATVALVTLFCLD